MTLLEYIKENGLSYSDVAKEIPCAPQYMSMVARGKANPSYSMACRIESITNGVVSRKNWYDKNE